jgi:hypothetical protein
MPCSRQHWRRSGMGFSQIVKMAQMMRIKNVYFRLRLWFYVFKMAILFLKSIKSIKSCK